MNIVLAQLMHFNSISLIAILSLGSASVDAGDLIYAIQPGHEPVPDSYELEEVCWSEGDGIGFNNVCHDCGGCSRCCNAPGPTMLGGSSLGLPFVRAGGGAFNHFANFYTRVAENNSAIPQDRVSFTYKFLNDVPVAKGLAANPDIDADLTHYQLGLEKTVIDESVSVELLLPFAYLPSSEYQVSTGLQPSEAEWQNIAFGVKGLLWQDSSTSISAGARVEAPTKEDIRISSPNYSAPRDVWAVTPYLAALVDLSDDLYFQSFLSYRMPTGGFTDSNGTSFREPNYFDVNVQLGYWIYRDPRACGCTGLQTMLELHYTGTFEPYRSSSISVTSERGNTDQLNLTAGMAALFNDRTTVSFGMVCPVRNGPDVNSLGTTDPFPSDRLFDWQAILQLNYYLR